MAVKAYLVPFPDPGAADLLSDHLEQEVHAGGPGKILIRVTAPRTITGGTSSSISPSRFARKTLELFKREGDDWKRVWGATTESDAASEEVSWDVPSPGTLKCRVTNMGGMEGQFSLECTYIPS